jgi:hypothetical protein
MANIMLTEEQRQVLQEKAAGYARARDEMLANANLNEGARIAVEALLNPPPDVSSMKLVAPAREQNDAN